MDYEEYKPAIRLGGGLAPSGSGTFPVARACDILMPDESRLDDYLANMEGGSGLPDYTEADNGKFLQIVDGSPAWVAITNAEEASF